MPTGHHWPFKSPRKNKCKINTVCFILKGTEQGEGQGQGHCREAPRRPEEIGLETGTQTQKKPRAGAFLKRWLSLKQHQGKMRLYVLACHPERVCAGTGHFPPQWDSPQGCAWALSSTSAARMAPGCSLPCPATEGSQRFPSALTIKCKCSSRH